MRIVGLNINRTKEVIVMEVNADKEYRSFRNYEIRAEEETGELIVEGYAAKFEEETVLFEHDGIEYKEIVKRGAFDGADMKNVIFRYNHEGKVMARTRNKTLQLSIDDVGLYARIQLSGTKEGKEHYEEIRGGYIDEMSFAFKIEDDYYNKETRTRELRKFKKIFDVASVDIPAYSGTSISARSYFEAQQEELKRQESERRRKKLALMARL